jgi:hypothetical protein
VADVPTAADENAADGPAPGDAMEAGWKAAWFRVSRAADVRVDEKAEAEAWYAPVRGASRQAWGPVGGVRRAAAAVRRCCRPVSVRVWPRVLRPARAWSAVTLAAVPADDPVHATRVAALRRDSRRGGRATAGKTVFLSPLFPLRYLENVESVCRSRGKRKGRRSI